MEAFLEPLRGFAEFDRLKKAVAGSAGIRAVSGCVDPQKPHLMYGIDEGRGARLLVAASERRARELLEGYRFFDRQALYFPAKDILFYQSDIRGNALTRERLKACQAMSEQADPVIVTTFDALMDRLVRPERMRAFALELRVGDTVDLARLQRRLAGMGYESAAMAEEPGLFAARGGILDIFPLTAEIPCRIELWGDEIDSIRSFSPESQRSLENLEEVFIYPASELVLEEERLQKGLAAIRAEGERLARAFRSQGRTQEAWRLQELVETAAEQAGELGSIRAVESFLPYFYQDTVGLLDFFSQCAEKKGEPFFVYVDEPARCLERAEAVEREFADSMQQRLEKGYVLPGQADILFGREEIAGRLHLFHTVFFSVLEGRVPGAKPVEQFHFSGAPVHSYNSSFEYLARDLKKYKKEHFRVILLCRSMARAERMAADLAMEGLSAFQTRDTDRVPQPGEVMVLEGKLRQGFACPEIRFVVLTETDIFGARKKRPARQRRYEGERIRSFSELKVGDYVVHENHGLGIYRGIEKIEVDKTVRDYMKIEYDQGGVLYVLATQLDLIQKYAGSGAGKPKLNRLDGQEWQKTKRRVRRAVGGVARELVELYAARQQTEGYRYGPDTVWQREFEDLFPYEETGDQLAAIAAVKEDMESDKIMDRLICGDVGFGKTEVAIRAAFKAVQEGRQVVYLVPTTILAQQHYDTFSQRMQDYPVNVELLCRFRTEKQQRETIDRMKRGLADIVIGTHRVLSKDVSFRDLGLLIIDEEQRFGVRQKEKIKNLKKNVDVLSLTATPIPRTLHMSLVGIRDMSILEEPPRDRMPVQTYVMEYDEEMVREAISRELARGGQVYYVFNRVNQIEDVAAEVAGLVPDAVVAYAHGQMRERELESVMYSFINREIDVLVSTTIIETGLDIPNVNTMIIHDADRMGLSQLYQLRGRIGRSNRTAYAFLMYRRDRQLREVAEKRLAAIREFSDLGSGYRIAMKDLEIRGAGNLLGEEQHGHMEAVGYDLYCKMLSEAVREAKGEAVEEESFDTSIDVRTDAHIPDSYIPDEQQKLDIYKRVAAIRNEEERDEMLDELIDRYGEPPRSVRNLLLAALLKAKAHELYLVEIKERPGDIVFRLYERAKLNPANIQQLADRHQPRLSFYSEKKGPAFYWKKQKGDPGSLTVISGLLEDFRELLALREQG